jgi:hypothetical protein
MRIVSSFFILNLMALLMATAAFAGDWPQWRGPERNGLAPGEPSLAVWPQSGPVKVSQADFDCTPSEPMH